MAAAPVRLSGGAAASAAAIAAALPSSEAAWLVGGCVRDAVLALPAGDLDVVVAGDAGRLARAVADRLGGAVFTYSERFSAYRVMADGGHIDLAPLRGDSLAADLGARDFTINAMACGLAGGSLIDPLGGAADLAARRLRLCRPDALTADPLRVLRTARFACGHDLAVGDDVVAAANAAAPGLVVVSGERVAIELSGLLALPRRVAALRLLDRLGGLAVVLPELTALHGVEQNPYHHLDVFDHTLEALQHLPGVIAQLGGETFLVSAAAAGLPGVPTIVPLAWATLCHDLGKPAVRKVDEAGKVMFWNHDEVGAEIAAAICRRLHMSRHFEAYLQLLVRQHLRLGFLVRESPLTRRALACYRRDVAPFVFESLALSLADRMATRGSATSEVSIARHFRLARSVWGEVAKAPQAQLLTGADVMRLREIPQSPLVGAVLTALSEEAEAGEVSTREEAERFVRDWRVPDDHA